MRAMRRSEITMSVPAARGVAPAEQERQLADVRGKDGAVYDRAAENRAGFGARLARAAKLRGQDVHANHREVGEIEDLVLDLDRGTAIALMEANDDFVRADGNFLVPLKHFQFTADRDALTTTLAATDFPQTLGKVDRDPIAGTATKTDRNRGEVQLTPTGRDANTYPKRNIDPTLQSAARSLRQIWDAHPDLAKLDLRVTAENGKLMFRGNVPNEDLWERAKDTAEGVIRGIDIENHISITTPAR
jgi:hypothetical protein